MRGMSNLPASVAMTSCLAALAADLPSAAPVAFRLLPLGSFRAVDGRPEGIDAWILTKEDAERIAADLAALSRDLPIDYEHQILEAKKNGQPAPAAGWIKRLGVRLDGDAPGLWAEEVVWTERARQMIAAGEYRYVSPVFRFDPKTGRITALLMAALTNHPGLDGLTDLQPLKEDTPMSDSIAALRAALGATDPAIDPAAAAVEALRARDAEIARLKKEVEAVQAAAVPLTEHAKLQAELAALTARVEADEKARLIDAGLSDGRILPTQKDYWSQQPIAALKEWLKVAQPVAALTGQQSAKVAPNAGKTAALSAEAEHLVRIAGWKPEVFHDA